MDRHSPARIPKLNLVARNATINFARYLGVPYALRPCVTMAQADALLEARSKEQEIAEGFECIAAFRRYGEDNPSDIPIPDKNEDPARVCKTLRELIQFERASIETEVFIDQELAQIDAAARQLQNNAQQAQAQAQAQFPDHFDNFPAFPLDDTMMDMLDFGAPPPALMNWEPAIDDIVERLKKLHERIYEDILGTWKHSQLYNDAAWKWPDCPKIYGWLKQEAKLGLRLYTLSPNSINIDSVLTNIFNDTFLFKQISSPYIVYELNQKKENASIEFRHLLDEFFTPEATPLISVVNEDQVQSSFSRPKGSGTCADVANNVGEVMCEGPTNLLVKFENLKIGKPTKAERSQGRRVSGDATGGHCRVSREKYWFICEMNVHVRGWKPIKLTAISPAVAIRAHCNQFEASVATLQFENAGFSRKRGHFFAPRELDCTTVTDSLSWLTLYKLGKPFSEINKQCIMAELLRVASSDGKITLEQMSPDPAHQTIPSPFEFYYGFVELVNQHLRELWDNGLIMGWITREHVQTLLQDCDSGTTIIRPTFSLKNAVTISWKYIGKEVHSYPPWTAQKIKSKGLVQRMNGLPSQIQLTCIYPYYPVEMLNTPGDTPPSSPPSPPMEDEGPAPPSPPQGTLLRYVRVAKTVIYLSSRARSV